ncbi:MAG: SRPBCC family protein [Ancalomicrobiaceae bacterium]|nr:SRPBCC family protein [Ancalomicrobiaceae bacterium]
MARAYASAVIGAPVDQVWAIIRDFNGLPGWHPAIVRSEIEGGKTGDTIGAIRSFYLTDGSHAREQLVALDDRQRTLFYVFATPAFPVANYVSQMRVAPVTDGGGTFVEWIADFEERPEDAGKYVDAVTNGIFASGLAALKAKLA